ncbi:hypothetical protein L3X38_043164 [Prunus dulcis]|uniref:Uncharacterized protein n=1 Tax=Prunus dulcis TaxID=3755 RepID=A0AAD4YMN3_PRUDU|nr:hypothetical protein L3X38_043164 [Prunus dulcis]
MRPRQDVRTVTFKSARRPGHFAPKSPSHTLVIHDDATAFLANSSVESLLFINNALRVSGTPELRGVRNATQAIQWSPEACKECSSDRHGIFEACEDCDLGRLGISKACEECGLGRLGISEACEDGIDKSGMGVRLGRENSGFEMFLN